MSVTTAATFCATLVDEWVDAGLQHAVIAPGSRSTPLALALADASELQLHVFHDERAAAFAALGIGLATGRPAALLCTSGTAATHFHAAVVEAHQSHVPLLVCTADRPPELRDVGAPQTIDQTRLYGPVVRWFHDPGVPDEAASGAWRSLAQRAFGAATGVDPGPVHLNLPFRDPLVGEPGLLPAVRNEHAQTAFSWPTAPVVADGDLRLLARTVDRQRGVIVAGRGAGAPADVAALSEATGWPVLADPRSGCRGLASAVCAFDELLRHDDFARAHAPEVVVALGEPPASKVLAQWIAGSGAEIVQVSAHPGVVDPGHVVGHRVVCDPARVCSVLAGIMQGATGTPWAARWRHAEAAAQAAIASALSARAEPTEPAVARALTDELPRGSQLVVSSSMPVRDVEWYGSPRADIAVHANRGANGIDGVIATAIGIALATRLPTALLIGDIAFVHDSSALVGLAARSLDLTIVVVDNDGGGIFSFLPQAVSLPASRYELLFGTPHGTDLLALAAAHGLPATDVTSIDDLRRELRTTGTGTTTVLRVRTDRAENVVVHDELHRAVAAALG
ncbi:MAG: 2-succinyl-5-enolpyruvyl-6-hydroxy-3-cyclohexene-1-carboxylic-acid synthase [Acidimicrobiia bacterium]